MSFGRNRHELSGRVLWAWVGLGTMAAMVLGCTATSNGDGAFDDDAANTTVTSTFSEGVGGNVGSGGQGGEANSTTSPCGIDCSTIQAPQCYVGACDTSSNTCVIVPVDDGESCDDGLFCTVEDSCESGECVAGKNNDCGVELAPCEEVSCSEEAQACTIKWAEDGTSCESDNLCLVNTTCDNGECVGSEKDCFFAPMPDDCHYGVCNSETGECDATPDLSKDGEECSDSTDLCTEGKTCLEGVCQGGEPKDCSSMTDGCNNGVCNDSTGECEQEVVAPGGTCLEATDDCNVGICDDFGACVATASNEGATCDDGDACTVGETCALGACTGGSTDSYEVYFSETFANNNAGWTLGTEWEIGSTEESSGASSSLNEDPASDHTSTSDNGVAGAVIGGLIAEVAHDYYYLVSPEVDTSAVTGSVYVEYWRWLNSDYTPYMTNAVDVYDGSKWVNLWTSGGYPSVKDSSWTQISFDVTDYKNAEMKVRFGHKHNGSTGAYNAPGWNVDDFVIANAVCD